MQLVALIKASVPTDTELPGVPSALLKAVQINCNF